METRLNDASCPFGSKSEVWKQPKPHDPGRYLLADCKWKSGGLSLRPCNNHRVTIILKAYRDSLKCPNKTDLLNETVR